MGKVLKTPLKKNELITELAGELSISKETVNALFTTLQVIAVDEVRKAGEFTVPGLGKLVLARRKARMGRNPATGETIKIPAKTVLKFKISKICKDSVFL